MKNRIMDKILKMQYDTIYSFFKTTTEPFDSLEWDGEILQVILNGVTIEKYSYTDLLEIIPQFPIHHIIQ